MNAQSRPFEEYFFHHGIPFRLVGTVRFYSREEVRDVVAFLKLLDNPRDEVSFRRVVNKPARGVGTASVSRVLAEWQAGGGSLLESARRAAGGLPAKARAGLAGFLGVCDELAAAVDSLPLAELVRTVMLRSGLHASYESRDRADDTVEGGEPRGAGERHGAVRRGQGGAAPVPDQQRPAERRRPVTPMTGARA